MSRTNRLSWTAFPVVFLYGLCAIPAWSHCCTVGKGPLIFALIAITVRNVQRKLGWREVGDDDDWEVYWTDTSVGIERIMKLTKTQVCLEGVIACTNFAHLCGHGHLCACARMYVDV